MKYNQSPVFIVAPVRSGSTLLRLMLDAHPDIINPGECDFLFDRISDVGQYPELSEYAKWLSINRIFKAKKIKLDDELCYLGLMQSFIDQFKCEECILTLNVHRHFHRIPLVFSNARYIHLLRDPRDVAQSCIGMGWVGHVYQGVDIWLEAEKSWDKLKSTLTQAQYLEIKYEDLLEDIESGLEKICDFLGLEYSRSMLGYAKTSTYALPDKKFCYQWKHKYSKRELQLVEGKVSELLLDRGYKLSDYSTIKPSVFERVWLSVINKKFRVKYQINKYGGELYVKNFIAKKLRLTTLGNACQVKIDEIDMKGLK